MPEHIQYEDDDLFNPETHHEHSDVPVRPLFWFIVGFIIFSVVSHVALYLLYKGFVAAERKRMEAPQTQVERPKDADVPQNQPLLQPFPRADVAPQRQTPVTDMIDMRRAEDQRLNHYGWVDRQHGVVHIPIEEAKKAFAANAAAQPQTTPPTLVAPTSPQASGAAGFSQPAAPAATATGAPGGLKPAAPPARAGGQR
jgi:hypothetical protein